MRKIQIINGHKSCSVCNQLLPVEDFGKDSHSCSGYYSSCKSCIKMYHDLKSDALKDKTRLNKIKHYEKIKRSKEKIKENPYDFSNSVKRRLAHVYNLSIEDYNKILESQNDLCAICKKHKSCFKQRLCVDHNHTTGKNRGLLCINCNSAIGKLNDDTCLLEEAIKYIKKYE